MRRASIIGVAVTAAAGLGVSGVAAAAGKAPPQAELHRGRRRRPDQRQRQPLRDRLPGDPLTRRRRRRDQDGVLLGSTYPVTGNDTMKLFYADGVQRMSDTFTRGAPHTDGIGEITGKGTCTTGSGLHKGEKCTYTITGTYDLNTGVTKLRLAGTFTR